MTDAMHAAIERMAGSARTAAASLRVKSALNPMLWLCGMVSLPSFTLAYFVRDYGTLSTVLIVVGSLPVAANIVGFFYFMIRSPERLQSEEYQIRQATLDLIKSKGSPFEILPSSLEAISNPVIVALPRQEKP
jgi:hypothetical protein